MESKREKLNIDTIIKSQEYAQALREIRSMYQKTSDTYLLGNLNENDINKKNRRNYDDEKDDIPNVRNEKEGKKRRRKNSSNEKPKKKQKKKKTE